MAKKYISLDKPIKQIPAAELRELLGNQPISVLMRTIILNEHKFCSVTEDRSLRGFWYGTVKPTLDKLGLLTASDIEEEKMAKWDAELSRYMAELVKLGELSYKSLRIVDNSRQRQAPEKQYTVTSTRAYGYQIQSAEYSNIIICTEKDTVYNIIEKLASLIGCSCISAKGQNSFAAMEDLIRQILAKSKDKPIYILTLTDYDPAGYIIADTFKNQIENLRATLNFHNEVKIKRIGITPDQLSESEVLANMYTPKGNMKEWMNVTNGINGQAKGLELDALSNYQIRRIFVESIKPFINPNDYNDFIKRAFLKKFVLNAAESTMESIFNSVCDQHLQDIRMHDFDLWDLAQSGYDYFPIDKLCFSDVVDEIKRKVISHFKVA